MKAAVVLLALGVVAVAMGPVAAQGPSHDHFHRTPVHVTYHAEGTPVRDFPVWMFVDTAAMVADGTLRADCSDLRVTLAGGTDALWHWVESGCNTPDTKIWFRVPVLTPGRDHAFDLVHGSPTAPDRSDMERTLAHADELREHWDHGTTTGWSITGAPYRSHDTDAGYGGSTFSRRLDYAIPSGNWGNAITFRHEFPQAMEPLFFRVQHKAVSDGTATERSQHYFDLDMDITWDGTTNWLRYTLSTQGWSPPASPPAGSHYLNGAPPHPVDWTGEAFSYHAWLQERFGPQVSGCTKDVSWIWASRRASSGAGAAIGTAWTDDMDVFVRPCIEAPPFATAAHDAPLPAPRTVDD